jgi:hypothetical protein
MELVLQNWFYPMDRISYFPDNVLQVKVGNFLKNISTLTIWSIVIALSNELRILEQKRKTIFMHLLNNWQPSLSKFRSRSRLYDFFDVVSYSVSWITRDVIAAMLVYRKEKMSRKLRLLCQPKWPPCRCILNRRKNDCKPRIKVIIHVARVLASI